MDLLIALFLILFGSFWGELCAEALLVCSAIKLLFSCWVSLTVLNEVLYWTPFPSFLLPLLLCRDVDRKSEATGRVGVASTETKQDMTSVP